MSAPALLEVRSLSKRFGALRAVDGLDFEVREGEITGLIGPNGAGKTTAFSCIAGAARPSGGSVRFDGREIAGMRYDRVSRLGLVRTYQVVQTFADMTVREAVLVGALLRHRTVSGAARAAAEVLAAVDLSEKSEALGASLTISDKKRLELARALATEPRLLLLDEVMAGLTPAEARDAVELLRAVAARGVTLLMVEHVMEVVMPLAHRVVVINEGRRIFDGTPAEAARDPGVVEAYLGPRFVA